MTQPQRHSPIFEAADRIIQRMAANDPIFATDAGIPGYDELLPDYSTSHLLREQEQTVADLRELEALAPTDEVDRIAKEVIRERLTVALALLDSGEVTRTFSVIRSPLSSIRQVFELMAVDTAEDAVTVRTRLANVRPSLDSWRSALLDAAASGHLPAVRHLEGVAEQAQTHSEGAYVALAQRFARSAGVGVDESGLRHAAEDAEAACRELSQWMGAELVPLASTRESIGEDRYQRWAAYFNGATYDLRELYEWGYQDLRRINARMWEIAEELVPGASSLVQVADHLDRDPARAIVGTDELLARLKAFTASTVAALDGVHFDIDDRIKYCDARLAPAGAAGAPYYIGPSEDLSRPGTTWFPTLGATSFAWWRFASTWYHESVPGHHLQIATALLASDHQSRFHRLVGGNSGYIEGWALYAERLMDELGYFSDPGDELGYLSGQALRAARVVVDIGLHLELDAPHDLGELGGLGDCSRRRWTAEMAVALLEEWAIESHAMSVSEVDRYLGMPAQAISYKVGERAWLEVRSRAQSRLGDRFDLKAFHAHALVLGPLGLDTFASEMDAWDGGA